MERWQIRQLLCPSVIVYFCLFGCFLAERVSSLGKDWHRPCLKCEKCRKTLSAGSHAEHDGKPYCNNPCYSAMFGPKGKTKYEGRKRRSRDLMRCSEHASISGAIKTSLSTEKRSISGMFF
uniref:LIM zinc-binding domain-containing protein n=1 Tax=Oryzias sinensis TaxID=183150 RepID=A0A8C7X072_9TELE